MVGFAARGWRRFAFDPALAAWVDAVRPAALATLDDARHANWWRNDRTWFVGVNALENDETGALVDGPPLAGRAVAAAHALAGPGLRWDRAQISAILPGYPRQGDDSDTAFAFRCRRDAAHVDGLHLVDGRRVLRETQALLLGVPLTRADAGASPLVVWQGSHRIIARALARALRPHPVRDWPHIDLSAPYKAARRQAFADCPRIALPARPGQAYLLHRLALHGVSPWTPGARSDPPGRVIAYFRPDIGEIAAWPAA